jgi:hypothetical protein
MKKTQPSTQPSKTKSILLHGKREEKRGNKRKRAEEGERERKREEENGREMKGKEEREGREERRRKRKRGREEGQGREWKQAEVEESARKWKREMRRRCRKRKETNFVEAQRNRLIHLILPTELGVLKEASVCTLQYPGCQLLRPWGVLKSVTKLDLEIEF